MKWYLKWRQHSHLLQSDAALKGWELLDLIVGQVSDGGTILNEGIKTKEGLQFALFKNPAFLVKMEIQILSVAVLTPYFSMMEYVFCCYKS